MSDIEIRLFRYFVALAEERHFAHAALRLKITPPTLTHQIKKLESELGAKLVVRKGNTLVTLTEAGLRFLARAQEVLHHVEQAAAVARQAERGEVGRIDLGACPGHPVSHALCVPKRDARHKAGHDKQSGFTPRP